MVLSGPSFAREIAEQQPTAVTLACREEAYAISVQTALSCPWFRCYTHDDVIGVEVGGALKNVVAIAVGMCDGLGRGLNARAGLMTRGLREITRLGEALGANPLTFLGLSGMGDLILTCTGDLSRNRQVGLELGRGKQLAEIVGGMKQVAEGVRTTYAVCALAERLGVDMPIARGLRAVLEGELTPVQAGQLPDDPAAPERERVGRQGGSPRLPGSLPIESFRRACRPLRVRETENHFQRATCPPLPSLCLTSPSELRRASSRSTRRPRSSTRLEALGFLPATEVRCRRRAPLGDPRVYELRGTQLCLRRSEAARIKVELR